MNKVSIYWYRQDLRIKNNPALDFALDNSENILPLYILDDSVEIPFREGSASKWWLHHSLINLEKELLKKGAILHIKKGNPLKIITSLIKEYEVSLVCWNRCYEPHLIERDKKIKAELKALNVACESFNGSLLIDPWQSKNKTGKAYQVFTPFWKNLQDLIPEREEPRKIDKIISPPKKSESLAIEDLKLLPKIKWDKDFYLKWDPGEEGAHKTLNMFLKKIDLYKEERDFPSIDANSKLSPHLHFGEISPLEVWRLAERAFENGQITLIEPFLRQLGWREFAYNLLFHFPLSINQPLRSEFNKFPWTRNKKHLIAWQKGETGYPIIDAGMRELWATGIMHNRVRMLVGSFLVKNLLIHWKEGAEWFWDTLVDADLANNTMGWQWVAGSGADAAPYFRIFNPVTQSEKFDKQGEYIKKWVPELKELPGKIVHAPYLESAETLAEYGIILGKNYPKPIVDLKETRETALDAYKQLRQGE